MRLRPLVIVAGTEAPIYPVAGVKEAYRKAKAIYAAAGAPDKIRLIIEEDGHRFYKRRCWKVPKKLMGL